MKYKIFILCANDFEGARILSTIRNEITYENPVSFTVGREVQDISEYHILFDKCGYAIDDVCCSLLYNDIYLYTRNKKNVEILVRDFICGSNDIVEVIVE